MSCMFFLLFIAAAALATMGLRVSLSPRASFGPRPEGLSFVLSVFVVAVGGFSYLALNDTASLQTIATPDAVTARPILPTIFTVGLRLWILTIGVYLLSALRGVAGLPAWIADLLVIAASYLAIKADPELLLSISASSRPDSGTVPLGPLALPLTILWIWMIARFCAALNRVPVVTGGYLGLVSGLVLLLMTAAGMSQDLFPTTAMAALSGAGLAAFVVSLRSPQLNLGWSSTLAMGFVLGLASARGLLQNTLPAILALALLALVVPLLDVTLVQVRARLRGQNVEWSRSRQRLHETLAARGVPQRKIALLYFVLGLWGCTLAYGLTRWASVGAPNLLVSLLYTVVFLAVIIGGGVGFFSIARLLMRRTPGENVPESIEAFGVKISPVSMDEALDKIEEFIADGTPHHVLTSDANAILTSKTDEDYAGIMRRAAMITPDGFGVIWGARLLNLPIYERVTGVDMVTGVCERAAAKGYRLYILGSEEGVAATAARNLMERYPGLQVVGTHHGFWRRDGKAAGLTIEEADARMAEEIAATKVDVLFVAMGIPMQEKFIAAQLERMQTPVALGVGGSFDVYAGKFNRAPQYVQRVGLEWLYRVWIDPSRWKRMGYVPKFMVVALRTWIFGSKPGTKVTPDAF